jgi:hypothetical protein
MSSLKSFLITGFVLLLIAAGAVGYVWFKLQSALSDTSNETSQEEVVYFIQSDDTPIANTVPDEGIQIDTSSVSVDQKAAAEKVGIDIDSIVITPEMISCAELKLGSPRLQEIIEGASPTTLESISLIPCL